MIVALLHEREGLAHIRIMLYQSDIVIRFVVRTSGHLIGQTPYLFLYLANIVESLLDLFVNRVSVLQTHHLRQIAYADPLGACYVSGCRFFHAGNQLEQRTLAGTVFPYKGDTVAPVDDE